MGFGSGQGVKCYHSEHLYGEFWHRAFTVSPDTPLCDYLISCGANVEASGGVVGVWRHADARARGMKRVQVEPHLSVTGACSAEWVPIKPKTDAAFPLCTDPRAAARDCRASGSTSPSSAGTPRSPYLVGPNGYYLRDRASASRWCGTPRATPRCRSTRPMQPRRSKGGYEVDAVEIGPDDEVLGRGPADRRDRVHAISFAHMAPYSPEWAERICDVPAATMRRIAHRVHRACPRRRDDRDRGHALPFRPVAVSLGKTVNNGWGGYECCWARTMLARWSAVSKCPAARSARRCASTGRCPSASKACSPGPTASWPIRSTRPTRRIGRRSPNIRNAYRTMVPLAGNGPWSQALGPTHFSWMFLDDTPKGLPRVTAPDVWFVYRTNPAISFWDTAAVGRQDGALPVRGRLRLYARRDESFCRRAAARCDRSRKPAADPHRRLEIRRAVLGPAGLRAAPAGRRDARRGARLHRHRHRARAAHRTARKIQRRDQQRRGRRAAQG